jgi:hypothetical protein
VNLFAVAVHDWIIFLGPSCVAFFTAACFTGLELVTSKYPRTAFVVIKDYWFWSYILIYGVIATLGFWGLDALVAADKIKLEGLGLDSSWMKALYVGIAVKALLHINVARMGATPIGTEIIVQLFEPHWLRTILLNEFNAVRAYVAPYVSRYSDLSDVKKRVKENIPPTLPDAERAAFESDLEKAATVVPAMELFLRFVGLGTFKRVFPL